MSSQPSLVSNGPRFRTPIVVGRKMSSYGSFGIKIVVVNEWRRALLPLQAVPSRTSFAIASMKMDHPYRVQT
jgi:hypothetical protein